MYQARCFSLARTMQLHINPFQHCVQIVRDLRIPEADHTVSLSLKPKLARAISFCNFVIVVMPAIELDDEMGGRTKEIDHIRPYRRLTSKVRTEYRKFFDRAPQCAFVRRGVRSQLPCCRTPD